LKKSTYILFIFSFCFLQLGLAQSNPTKSIKGTISAKNADVDGVYIYNQNKKNAVTSDIKGFFTLAVSIGDTLIISSVQFKRIKFAITKKQYDSELLYVEMENYTNQLEEVQIIKYKNLDAVSLGILDKPAKVYTPAERRLYTASSMTVGTIITLDPLLNWISGRTAQLKKGVTIEKKQFAIEKIDYLFEDSYFITILKIPKDYVEGFKYYIVEDDGLRDALNRKNKTMAKFLMTGLATDYNKIIKQ
jgi:CarboxypepD_reg-like domain